MPSIESVRHLRAALAAVLATMAVSLVGCSGTSGEDLGQVELRQDNEPAPTCDDKFECDCEKVGGTVDGPDWCCKHYDDGSSICTNQPGSIIEWLETPPGPDRPPHVQDIPGIKLELSGFAEPKPINPDPEDPAFVAVCESLKKQAEANKGQLLEFDPNTSGFPGSSQRERFDSEGCHNFCDLVVSACDFIACAPTDYVCQIRCQHIGMNCDFMCVDLLIASEYP